MQTLLQETSGQPGHTLQMHAMPATQALCHDMSADKAPAPGIGGPREDVAGQGTLQDFSSAVCNAGSPEGKALLIQTAVQCASKGTDLYSCTEGAN